MALLDQSIIDQLKQYFNSMPEAITISAFLDESDKSIELDSFLQEVSHLEGELQKALQELPDSREIPQLLERISDKARDSGLDVRLFRPQIEQLRDFYAEVPVDIEVSGTYHQVASFFDEVGHMERIVNLGTLSMSEPKKTNVGQILKTTVVATSFRFVDESEMQKAAKPEENSAKNPKKESAKASADE